MQDNLQDILKTKGCVYMATSPSGKRYVGMTTNFCGRYKAHKWSENNPEYTMSRALHKYGTENFSWKILYISDDRDTLMQQEEYYISMYNTFKDGYNMNIGGGSTKGASRESKLKFINSRGFKPINVFKLPSLEFIKTYEIQEECSIELGITSSQISECLSGQTRKTKKPRSKKAGNYYITRDSVEHVNDNKESILSFIQNKQFDPNLYRTKLGYHLTIEERDKVAFGQTGKKYLISYMFSDKKEIHSNLNVMAEVTGENKWAIQYGLEKHNPFYINGFKIEQICKIQN